MSVLVEHSGTRTTSSCSVLIALELTDNNITDDYGKTLH